MKANKILDENKVSSSTLRYNTLGSLRKPPKKRSQQEQGGAAYVIGLTGGIACGKSSIAARLEKLGAAVVDCDKLGHKAYVPGTAAFKQVVERFGGEVVGEDGQINRPVLGAKVFGENSLGGLEALNAIVWPEIERLATEEIAEAVKRNSGKRTVCVLDAAVLLEVSSTLLLRFHFSPSRADVVLKNWRIFMLGVRG